MANKGENKTLKSLAAPKAMHFKRKKRVFVAKTGAGPHDKKTTVPIAFLLRNMLEVVDTMREAEFILKRRKVLVDGRVAYDKSFPVGFFDVIELIDSKKKYRLLFDRKGRLIAIPIKAEKETTKICKVVGKKAAKKQKIQVITNDGRTLMFDKTDIKVGDSLKLSLPDQKVLKHYKMKEKDSVYLIAGRHVGRIAKVETIVPSAMNKKTLLDLFDGKEKFQTIADNIIVVGEDKPEIELDAVKE